MKKLIILLLSTCFLFSCNDDDDDCNCSDPAGPPTPAVGEIVITEIMFNPSAVSDLDGEWFELFNISSSQSYDLTGLLIDSNNDEPVAISEELIIGPNEFIVLGRNSLAAENGGILLDHEYSGINLANQEDAIYLRNGNTVIDSVFYDQSFTTQVGASLNLDVNFLGASANDNPFNWCPSSSQLASGDFGTPRNVSEECP